MTGPETPRTYKVGDHVKVTGHYEWLHRDTHGHTGVVVEIHHPIPGFADTLYGCDLDGFTAVVTLPADELAPAGGDDR